MVSCGGRETPPDNQHVQKLALQSPGFPGSKKRCGIENWEQRRSGQRPLQREESGRDPSTVDGSPVGELLPAHLPVLSALGL